METVWGTGSLIHAKDTGLDLTKIEDIKWEYNGWGGSAMEDYFIASATFEDGTELTDEQLDDLNINHSDFVYEKLEEHLY